VLKRKIDWERVAQGLSFGNEKEMWEALYVRDKLSLAKLETYFGVTKVTVRKRLLANGFTMRKQGGAQIDALKIGDDQLVQEVEEFGIESVSRHYDVTRACIFQRVRKIRARRAAEAKGADS
jgi:hypothetical protein